MKNIARKTLRKKSNVLSLVDNSKFKANQAETEIKQAENRIYTHTLNFDAFLFQKNDVIFCRPHAGEGLSPNDVVVARTANSDRTLTSVANAVEIIAVVVAYKREVHCG